MSLDEFEAIRLADGEGMKQEDAALEMQVSRPTFGRILEAAHRKVAGALVRGSSLRIQGGAVCTEASCAPRDCPRWNRSRGGRGLKGRSDGMLPCGRPFPESCGEPRIASRGHHATEKKGESS